MQISLITNFEINFDSIEKVWAVWASGEFVNSQLRMPNASLFHIMSWRVNGKDKKSKFKN